ncbi:hypothetical protein ACWPKS_15940 [Coraliomargarita sp. W4R72]
MQITDQTKHRLLTRGFDYIGSASLFGAVIAAGSGLILATLIFLGNCAFCFFLASVPTTSTPATDQ